MIGEKSYPKCNILFFNENKKKSVVKRSVKMLSKK